MRLPRIGIVAGHGVDVSSWLAVTQLPDSYDWYPIADSTKLSVHDLDGLLWLWKPGLSSDVMQAERNCLKQWCTSIVRSRNHQLMPIMVVATGSLQELDEQSKQQHARWLSSIEKMIRQTYRQEIRGWAPASLVDPSRILIQAKSPEEGRRLVDLLDRQRTSLALWQRRIHRQGERCLASGLALTTLYVSLLLLTVPWKASAKPAIRTTEPQAWAKADWQTHIKDCRALLQEVDSLPLEKLSAVQLQRINENLRWLPISLDLLQQKRSSREVIRLRGQVQELLQTMEGRIERWSQFEPGISVDAIQKHVSIQTILDGVFDPRLPPTTLHQVSQQFWVRQRAITLSWLKSLIFLDSAHPVMLSDLLSYCNQRRNTDELVRIHAPELKAAYLQELNVAIDWLEKAKSKPSSITRDDFANEAAPSLIRDAANYKLK